MLWLKGSLFRLRYPARRPKASKAVLQPLQTRKQLYTRNDKTAAALTLRPVYSQ